MPKRKMVKDTVRSEEKILAKYTSDQLILEAETLEETGGYLHFDLFGLSPEELRKLAEKKGE